VSQPAGAGSTPGVINHVASLPTGGLLNEEEEEEEGNSDGAADADDFLAQLAGSVAGSDPMPPKSSEREKMMDLLGESVLPSGQKRNRDGSPLSSSLLGDKSGLLQLEVGLDGSKRRVLLPDKVRVLKRVQSSKDTALWCIGTLNDLAGLLIDTDNLSFLDHNWRFSTKTILKLIEDHVDLIQGFAANGLVSPKVLRIISTQKLNIVSKLRKLSTRKFDDPGDRTLLAPLVAFYTEMMDKVPKGTLFPIKTKTEGNANRNSYSSPSGHGGGGGGKKEDKKFYRGKGGGGQGQNSKTSSAGKTESSSAPVKGKD